MWSQCYIRVLMLLDLLTASYISWRARHGARIRMRAQVARWSYEGRLRDVKLSQVVKGKIVVRK